MISNWIAQTALWMLASSLPMPTVEDRVAEHASPGRLELVAAYPVVNSQPTEPSGLFVRDGTLYTVCDKTENTIFRLELDGEVMRMVPHLEFVPPPKPSGQERQMDLEGITADDEGNFYLISEQYFRTVRVTPAGEAEWFGPSLEPVGRENGLFRVMGGGFEGIVFLDDGHLLFAAERQPRGIMELRLTGDEKRVDSWQMNRTIYTASLPAPRLPDSTGLFHYNGRIFSLFRNASVVVEIIQTESGDWIEGEAWSYAHVENDPLWRYSHSLFGHGEGLAIDESHIYVILDNNQSPRAADPEDNRPLLFIFKNPL